MQVQDFINDIFVGRCKDTVERMRKEDSLVFEAHVLNNFKGGHLALREYRIGPNAAMAIAKMLKSAHDVKAIDLYGNVVTSAGAVALAEALHSTPSPPMMLRVLNLGANDIGDEGGKAIGDMLKFNKTIHTLELGAGDYFWHDNNLGYRSAMAIAEGLLHNNTLTMLGLNRNLVGEGSDEGTEAIARMLKTNKCLRSLKLAHNFLGSRGGTCIAESMAFNNTLIHLDLTDNSLGPEAAQPLGQMIANQSSLITLNLSFNKLGSRGITVISESLKTNSSLVSLNLEENGMGDWGATAIADALVINKTLTSLNLSSNGIGKNGGVAVANALTPHGVLHTLLMNNNPLRDDTAVFFAEPLKNDEGLVVLELNSTKIGLQGGVFIATALADNHTLTTLKLNDNFLTEGAGQAMADLFAQNDTLTLIDVSGNQVNHTTSKMIKQVCKKNRAAKKMAEAAPLKLEIIRLKQEQIKLPMVEAALATEVEAVGAAQRVIANTEAQIMAINQDSGLEAKLLKKKLDDVNTQLAEEEKKLQDREDELKKIQDDYDQKIKELQQALSAEVESRESLEEALKTKSEEIELHEKQHSDKILELTQQIEQTRKETSQFRSSEKEHQTELTRLEDRDSLLPSVSQSIGKALKPGSPQKLPEITKMQKSHTSQQLSKSEHLTRVKTSSGLSKSTSSTGGVKKTMSSSSSGKAPVIRTNSVEKLPTKIKTVNLNVGKTPKIASSASDAL